MVFEKLDRVGAIYYPYEFNTGDLLTEAVAAKIAECGLFVLLGSKTALEAKWVQLETNVAQSLRDAGLLNETLLFSLGDATHEDFPFWLKILSIKPALNPANVAAAIHEKQLDLIDQIQNPVFLNRFQELELAEGYLAGVNADPLQSRKVISFHGQGGFGRRSLARRVFESVAGLRKTFTFRLESADDIRDIAIKLAQFGSKYSSFEELEIAIDEINVSGESELDAKTSALLSQIASANALLVVEDDGGFLDDDGFLTPASIALIGAIESTPGCYAAIINRRRPRPGAARYPGAIAVGDLSLDIAKSLLVRYAELANVHLRGEADVDALVARIGRHPGALRYGVELARIYGVDAVVADRNMLSEHNIERYWSEISRDKSLNMTHKSVLTALAAYESATLEILAELLGTGRETVADAIRHLIDLVLITVDGTGQYRLISALRDIVPRLFPGIPIDHDRGFTAFTTYVTKNPDAENRLSLERSRGVALALSKARDKNEKVLLLASDYLRIADEAYDDERYGVALEFAKLALAKRPANPRAITLYVQCAVKHELFDDATKCVQEKSEVLQPHTVEYLLGLIERTRGNYDLALNHFRRSFDLGRRGLSIHRELSLCFYKLGHVADAENHLRLAFERVHGAYNEYLLDLGIRIAISEGDEERARHYLGLSQVYDKRHHVLMLEAAVELAFGDPQTALNRLGQFGKSGLPHFARYLLVVADLRVNDLLSARKHLQDATWRANPIDIAVLSSALSWARGQREEALSRATADGTSTAIPRIRDLRRFIESHDDPGNAEARRELSILLINQGAKSSKR